MIENFPILVMGGRKNMFKFEGIRTVLNENPDIAGHTATAYPVSILKKSLKLFERCPVFYEHHDYQHKDLLGWIDSARWAESCPGLIAWYTPIEALRSDIHRRYIAESLPGVSGLYNVDYRTVEASTGRKFKLVEAIRSISAIDLVREPTAGGKFLSINEARRHFTESKPIRAKDSFRADLSPTVRHQDTFSIKITKPEGY